VRAVCDGGCWAAAVAALLIASAAPLNAQTAPVPDLSGQWGRDNGFFEQPLSGPGPVAQTMRRADGVMDILAPWVGDDANPILKPQAAEAVRKFGELALHGTVLPDLHNRCWPEPPPFVLAGRFDRLV
jgi:hypothetical protein